MVVFFFAIGVLAVVSLVPVERCTALPCVPGLTWAFCGATAGRFRFIGSSPGLGRA